MFQKYVQFQVKVAGSSDYKFKVTCADDDPTYVIMNFDRTEARCDTTTGRWDHTVLTPCCRTIDPTDDQIAALVRKG